MKQRVLAAILALALSLTGCASLLDREYSSVTAHNAAPTEEEDPSILRAESYQELVNALSYFVTKGTETGTIRLYLASDLVAPSLENACQEVVREDPLGAYAVDSIDFSVNSVITYSEAEIQIDYRRSREQIASIVPVTGSTAIRSQLIQAMESSAKECVLRVTYFSGDEETIHTLIHQAYLQNPTSILYPPDHSVSIYPDSGRQRVIEVKLAYPEGPAALAAKRETLGRQLHGMTIALATVPNEDLPLAAANAILSSTGYDPAGANTLYEALESKLANSEGLALAYAALCETLKIPCRVVEGIRNDTPHFWNLVETDSGWRHIDLSSLNEQEDVFLVDQEMIDSGHLWTGTFYPQTGPKSA